MSTVRNLGAGFDSFDSFEATWEPRIVQQMNDYDVRIAKCEGLHTWHSHGDTDEFFIIVAGEFTIHLRNVDSVVLAPGDTYVVPKGVEHCPEAAPGTKILMFEPQGTPSTVDEGDVAHLTTTSGITVE